MYFKNHYFKKIFLFGLLIFAMGTSKPLEKTTAIHAETVSQKNKQLWNLQEVDLNQVIREVSNITGKNFLVSPEVKAKVTFVSSRAISADEVYRLFLSILKVHGYVAIPAGNIIKIVPAAQEKPLMSMRVIPLHYLKASNAVKLLRGNNDIDEKDNVESSIEESAGLREINTEFSEENKNIKIIAEPNNNALIVYGALGEIKNIQSAIAVLDKRPPEVMVEAVIVEVSDDRAQNLGVEWEQWVGRDGINSVEDHVFNVGVLRRGNLKALIRALANDSNTNILSTPALMVLNNQSAKFQIGQKVPVTTGAYANTAGNTSNTVTTPSVVNPFTTTSLVDVNLYLNVRPQVSERETVRLAIEQGNSTLSGLTGAAGNPIINNSSIKTSVLINSGQILVLGGLMSKNLEETTQKIPFLGDIPGIGRLFQQKSHHFVNKNLMVFLRPVIVRNAEDANAVTRSKYQPMREKEIQQYDQKQWDDPYSQKLLVPAWSEHLKEESN